MLSSSVKTVIYLILVRVYKPLNDVISIMLGRALEMPSHASAESSLWDSSPSTPTWITRDLGVYLTAFIQANLLVTFLGFWAQLRREYAWLMLSERLRRIDELTRPSLPGGKGTDESRACRRNRSTWAVSAGTSLPLQNTLSLSSWVHTGWAKVLFPLPRSTLHSAGVPGFCSGWTAPDRAGNIWVSFPFRGIQSRQVGVSSYL